MKTRLGIFLLYLNLITQFALCQPNGRLHQVYGGSEFRLIHRPDISDSTYQIFLRKNLTWHGIQAGDANYIVSNTISISLVDTCSLRYAPITMLIYYESPSFLMNPISSFNPNTGDSASKRIFRVCSSSFQDSIIKFLSTGPNFGNGSGNIQPGFRDTFELLRDYWYDTLVNLPEPCGLWQIHDGGIAPWWSGTSYCGYGSGPSAFGSDFWFGSNVDTNYSPTYIYGNGVPNGADVSCKNGVTQINTSVANSSPYFLSYPTGVFVRNVPSFYAMNAVDPDGDSLVFSSISLVFPDSAQGNRPMSHFTPWAPFRQCIDYSASGNDTVITCFRNLNYLCPPGSVYPNCPRYDPVYNPFDTDSTFHINPNTGDITFIAKSAPQSPDLYIRCEEYRNGVWMGSVTRRIRFIIIDSTFYSQPKLKIDTANLVNCTYDSDFVFRACAGAPISIPFEALGINNVSQLKVKDNHPFALGTSSSVNYVNQATDSVRGVLQWTPPTNATGWYNLMVTVRDSVCSLTPYLFDHPYLLRIFIDDGVSAGKDTAICQGQSITLSAQILGNAPATWSVLSGSLNSLSCTNCSNPVASPTVTTTYVVQANLQGLNACKQKDTIVVRVHPAFTLLAKDTLLCGPATQAWLSAQVNPPVSGLTYQWSPSAGILSGANAPTVQLNPASATYVVTVSDTVGCFTRSDTVNIVYDPNFLPQLTAQPDGGICTGDSVQLSISGGGNMMWTPNYHISSLQGSPVWVWPDTSVTYIAEVQSNLSDCKASLPYTVNVTALRADAGPDYEIFDGEAVILGGPDMLCGPGCQLQWYPNQYLFFNHLMNPKAVPHETITYWVMLSNSSGTCQDQDSVIIRVKCTDIYMPNAFNPQSAQSEYTRHFGPRNVSIDLNYFRIFNRWGDMVFSTNDVSYRWDGTFQGKPQPAGTYVWVLEGKCPNGEWIRKSGNVMLVR